MIINKKIISAFVTTLVLIILKTNVVAAQNFAKINCDELIYNFETIDESGGPKSHSFVIKNEGNDPLIIHRITASCGCTKPEWSKEPIAPGGTSEVKITYDPTNRPGPFYKTISIYSNAENKRFALGIKGTVTPKIIQPTFIYPYHIGHLKLQYKSIVYSSIYQGEVKGSKISVTNNGKTSLKIRFDKLPEYLNITANPEKLAPGEIGEISILMDSHPIKHKGRITAYIPIFVKSIGEDEEFTDNLFIASNIIDDFSKLSKFEKKNAPIAQLSRTLIDFKKIPAKRAFNIGNNRISQILEIHNAGKSPLEIYSISSDDKRISIGGGKKTIKPGSTAKFKVTIQAKKIKTKFSSLVNVVCNDPHGPVRFIKITAEK